MTVHALLGPAAILVLWSLVVLLWMSVTRLKAFSGAGITLNTIPQGGRYSDVESDMPAKINWVSHNYTHLMEQPTIFYAVIAVLALAADTSELNVTLAWVYAGTRILHSVWQITSNVVMVRMALFTISTLSLWGLAINAVRLTVF